MATLQTINIQEAFPAQEEIKAGTEFYFYSMSLAPHLISYELYQIGDSIKDYSYRYHLDGWFSFKRDPKILETLKYIHGQSSGRVYFFVPPDFRLVWESCHWDLIIEDWYESYYARLNFWHMGERYYKGLYRDGL